MAMLKSRFFWLLLVTLAIILAATLTLINNNHATADRVFDKTELNDNKGQRKLVDLSCWVAGKPPGCNPPPTTNSPTKAPTSKSPTTPTPPPVTYKYSDVKIQDWDSKGYCTNTIPPGWRSFDTKESCCKVLANSPDNDIFEKCMDFEAVPLNSCSGLSKDACKASPICDYDRLCKMMCEGRDADHCKAQDECQYLSLKQFCTMKESQYQKASCARHISRTECGESPGCDWLYKQGQCRSTCGWEETKSDCNEVGVCEWDGRRKICNFDPSAPTPAPTLPRFCLNRRKKDKCNSYLPRCKWDNKIGKCGYACEGKTKKSDCDAKYCTWENKECLPSYEDYCVNAGKRRCEESVQCEWKSNEEGCISRCPVNDKEGCDGKTTCKWDPTFEVCLYNPAAVEAPMSDRFVRGNLFNR